MKLSNEEFINELMAFNKYGPFTQVFVIEALRYYSMQVSSTPAPTDESDYLLISPKLWHKIATDVRKSLEENYETAVAANIESEAIINSETAQ